MIFSDAKLHGINIYLDNRHVTYIRIDDNGHIKQTSIDDDDKNLWAELLGLQDPNLKLRSVPLEFITKMEENARTRVRSRQIIPTKTAVNDLQAVILRFGKASWDPKLIYDRNLK